ncbi:MAG: Hpt domain-containing protein [Novosphingobium sp.]|nr:Hpt domain-containing protein [Novosphingobium sp.]
MAYLGESFDSNLAAACGADEALFHELRAAFASSAERQLDLMRRARCDGNWLVAATRLRGLAASFHAEKLMDLADQAILTAPGDPRALREIAAHIEALLAPA